jgi:hypothetical protein
MLLQFKLDNVLELVPEKPSPTCGKPAEPPGAPAAPAGCVPLVKEAPVTASCDPLAQDAPAPAGSTISAEPADSEKSIPSSAMHAAEPVAPSGTPIDITQNIASDSASSDSNPKPGVEAVKQSDTLTRLIKGNITNGKDTLSNGSVIVEFNISQRKAPDLKNKLFYMFHQYNNECETAEYMCALPASISLIQLTLHNKLTLYNTIPGLRNPDITIVRGLGIAMKEDLEYGVVENQASFILCIINTKLNEIYRMIMYSPDSKLNHDSGFFKPSNERFSTNKL